MAKRFLTSIIILAVLLGMVACSANNTSGESKEIDNAVWDALATDKYYDFGPDIKITQLTDNSELLQDFEFAKVGDRKLKLNVVRPVNKRAKPMPVVVWIFGGGWFQGTKEGNMERIIDLAEHGYMVARIEYRYSSEAIFPAQIEDCKCAIRFLRAKAKEFNLDPDRMGVGGESAGGHLAALLGTSGDVKELEGNEGWGEFSSRVQAVCDLYGPTDFTTVETGDSGSLAWLLGGPPQKKRELAIQASPVIFVSKDDPPFLIIHGDNDVVVSIFNSQVLYDSLKKAGVDATLYVGKGGHGFDGPKEWQVMREFFDQHLKT